MAVFRAFWPDNLCQRGPSARQPRSCAVLRFASALRVTRSLPLPHVLP